MKKMQCEVCGSTEIKKVSNDVFECQSCGVQYSKEELKSLLGNVVRNVINQTSAQPTNTASNLDSVNNDTEELFTMKVEDKFVLSGRGTVIVGKVMSGNVCVGDNVKVGDRYYPVQRIEVKRASLDQATRGMDVGLWISEGTVQVEKNSWITK